MTNNILLFSMPGGGELIVLLFLGIFVIVSPILTIVYYSQAKRLRRENKELVEKLLDRKSPLF
ncbi:hypothetical protein [Ferruginibacter sp.]